MPIAHISGLPIEETLLSLGGPAALYLTAVALFAAVRRTRSRLRPVARRHQGVAG